MEDLTFASRDRITRDIQRLRILLVGERFDYGDTRRGDSVNYYQLLLPLRSLSPGTRLYDFTQRTREIGRASMNAELVSLVKAERPDVMIVCMYTDELEPAALREVRRYSTTVAYFYDDVWRQRYATFWARHFDLVTTSDPSGPARFMRAGCDNALYVPFSFNEEIFHRVDVDTEYDVSFVGLCHPFRKWVVDRMRRAGIQVSVFGYGWPVGRVTVDRMVEIFNSSRVNLNLSNSSQWDLRYLTSSPLAIATNIKAGKDHEQVKMRHVEIAGAGGFQMSYWVNYLSDYFRPDEEISVYRSLEDLIAKVRYFLVHDDERSAIAAAGHRRAVSEHSGTHRLRKLLEYVVERDPRLRLAPITVHEEDRLVR